MKLHRPSTITLKLIILIFLSVTTSRSQELEILGYWDFNDPSDPSVASDVTASSPDPVSYTHLTLPTNREV